MTVAGALNDAMNLGYPRAWPRHAIGSSQPTPSLPDGGGAHGVAPSADTEMQALPSAHGA
jgi:hypothetical protein